MREREDGPVVLDGAEVSVLRVREDTVVDELRANDDVLASLVRRPRRLETRILDWCVAA